MYDYAIGSLTNGHPLYPRNNFESENERANKILAKLSELVGEDWFKPRNGGKENDFDIAMQLHELGFLEMKVVPKILQGHLRGKTIYFRKIKGE